MSQWYFVIAAYAVTLVGTSALLFSSMRAMRLAERRAEEILGT
ncbi:MAG: hypothetical protein ABI667_02350 [Sphingomicrobium sp.]